MLCPRCDESLENLRVEETPLDRCPRCRGVFLDRGELDRIAEPHIGDLEYSTLEDDTFKHDDAYGAAGCPRCPGETMKKVEFNIESGIILDYCETCRGFWLDGRELQKIDREVKALNEAQETADPAPISWFATFIWSLPK